MRFISFLGKSVWGTAGTAWYYVSALSMPSISLPANSISCETLCICIVLPPLQGPAAHASEHIYPKLWDVPLIATTSKIFQTQSKLIHKTAAACLQQ